MNDEVARAPGPVHPRPTVGVVMSVPEVDSDLEEAIGRFVALETGEGGAGPSGE